MRELLKRVDRQIAFAMIAGALTLGWMVLSSEQGAIRPCEEGEYPYYLKEGRPLGVPECQLPWLKRNHDGIDLAAAFLTMAFTGILALFTYTLKRSTDMLWQSGEDQHVASNRAFVMVSQVAVTNIHDVFGGLSGADLVVMWQNSGNTPTTRMVVYDGISVRADDPPDGFDYEGNSHGPYDMLVGPHTEIGGDVTTLSVQDLADFYNSRKRVFVWGRAEYRDIFRRGEIHLTKFCYRLTAKPDGIGEYLVRMVQHGTYNDAN